MEIDDSKIEMLKRHISKHLFYLTKMIEKYLSIQDDLIKFEDQFNDGIGKFSFFPARPEDLYQLLMTSGHCRRIEEKKINVIREIDNSAGIVAGNIAVLIDICITDYNINLKRWVVEKIHSLADLREMASNSSSTDFNFPTIAAILSPYIFRTRFTEKQERFASLRNAIRELIN